MERETTPLWRSSAPLLHRRNVIIAIVVAIATGLIVAFNLTTHSLPHPNTASTASGDDSPSMFPLLSDGSRNLLSHCEKKTFTQRLDHFDSTLNTTFEQRYYLCGRDEFFDPTRPQPAIFFYTGNEADVLLYLNHTGLMWENAKAMNAILVFAEHRYFGQSIPFAKDVLHHMEYLSSTQALADFAVLIRHIKTTELKMDLPVIGFGGSYGGMLSAWLRLKYPNVVDGAIAASAPILNFMGDPEQPVDPEAFQRIVTFDMSPGAGSHAQCVPNIRRAIQRVPIVAATVQGRQQMAKAMNVCDPDQAIQSSDEAVRLLFSFLDAFGEMAMGNYPYPTSYIMDGNVELPTYPVRVACEHLSGEYDNGDDLALLSSVAQAAGVYYNASLTLPCFFPTTNSSDDTPGNFWGYLDCAELYMPTSTDGVHDFYPPQPPNITQDDLNCMATWGVHIRPQWAVTEYGGVKALRSASNIVFSNGNYDPWSGTGVTNTTILPKSVLFVPIEGGAHHLDLFFSNPLDPESVKTARALELEQIQKWIDEFYKHQAMQ